MGAGSKTSQYNPHNHYKKNYTECLDEVIGLRNFMEPKREKYILNNSEKTVYRTVCK